MSAATFCPMSDCIAAPIASALAKSPSNTQKYGEAAPTPSIAKLYRLAISPGIFIARGKCVST